MLLFIGCQGILLAVVKASCSICSPTYVKAIAWWGSRLGYEP